MNRNSLLENRGKLTQFAQGCSLNKPIFENLKSSAGIDQRRAIYDSQLKRSQQIRTDQFYKRTEFPRL